MPFASFRRLIKLKDVLGPVYMRPDECLSGWKFVRIVTFTRLTFPFTRSKKFVHLTFPFTWEMPESIRKAAFRIPTAEIVFHRSTDSNIKTTFLFHGFIFLYGAQRKRGGLPFTRYRRIFNRYKSEFVRFRRWTKIWADSCLKFERIGGSRVNAKPIRTNFHPD